MSYEYIRIIAKVQKDENDQDIDWDSLQDSDNLVTHLLDSLRETFSSLGYFWGFYSINGTGPINGNFFTVSVRLSNSCAIPSEIKDIENSFIFCVEQYLRYNNK